MNLVSLTYLTHSQTITSCILLRNPRLLPHNRGFSLKIYRTYSSGSCENHWSFSNITQRQQHKRQGKNPLFSSVLNHWPLKEKIQFCSNLIIAVKGPNRALKMKNNLGFRFTDPFGWQEKNIPSQNTSGTDG